MLYMKRPICQIGLNEQTSRQVYKPVIPKHMYIQITMNNLWETYLKCVYVDWKYRNRQRCIKQM